MKTVIVYPLPFDAWDTFKPYVKRFIETFKKFPPGVSDYELVLAGCWGEPGDQLRRWFYGTKARFVPYFNDGCDIGAAQANAWQAVGQGYEDALVLCLTSRCYFHRPGWLRRYVEARQKYGPGLYGAFASWESWKPHICTRGYALDADLFREYPHRIDTREKGQLFEVGEWSISDWFRKQRLPLIQVLWDNEQDIFGWRKWPGAFRDGEQQACLLWDKHTDAYRDAGPSEQKRLRGLCDVPSWSQEGEDRWIFENIGLPPHGTFVEVGAYDGVQSSNTLLFERMGWEGLCVEADPELVVKCQMHRAAMTIQCAVTSKPGEVSFYVNHDDRGLSGLTRPGKPIRSMGRRLDSILKAAKMTELDVLSIDTEGTELDVWDSLGTIRPRVVIMEHQTCDLPSQESPITRRMAADGYVKVHRTQYNLIFRRLDPAELKE